MAKFSAALLTAAPPGQSAEAGGAYVKIDGREALLRSVELFLNRDEICQIQLIVTPEELEEAKRKYGPHLSFSGVKLLAGGLKWSDQAAAAAKTLSADATHVILHDAARPIVSYADVDAVIAEAAKHDAVALTSPIRAGIIELDEGNNAMAYHRPSSFVQLLTPQAFSKAKFVEISSKAQDPHPAGWTLVKGSPLNIRIGGAGDAALAKSLIGMLPKPKLKAPSSPFEEAQW